MGPTPEDDLRVKSARLVELDTALNLDGKGQPQPEQVMAKSTRPSVLAELKAAATSKPSVTKPKTHEKEADVR